jgi:hypothetical protein
MSNSSTKRFRFEGAASIWGPNPYNDSGSGGGVSQASLETQLSNYVRRDGSTAMTAALPVAPDGIASAVDPTTGVRVSDQSVSIEAQGAANFFVGTTGILCENYLRVIEGSAAFPSIYDRGSKEDGLYFTDPGVNVSVGQARKLAILPTQMIVDTDQENKGNVTLTGATGKLTTYNLDAKNAVRADFLFSYTPSTPIVIGALTVDEYKLDTFNLTPMFIGDTKATSVSIGKTTVDTIIKGTLQCEQKVATNTIQEYTLNAGVNISGVLMRENSLSNGTWMTAPNFLKMRSTDTVHYIFASVFDQLTSGSRGIGLFHSSPQHCLYFNRCSDDGASVANNLFQICHNGDANLIQANRTFRADRLDSYTATDVKLGTVFANSVTIGRPGLATLIQGSLVMGGAIDSVGALALGWAAATSVTIGRVGFPTTVNGRLAITNGTALLPGIAFSAQNNTGMFAPANGHVGLSADGKIYLDIEPARTDVYNDFFTDIPFGGSHGGTYFAPLNLVTNLVTNTLTLLNFGTAMQPQFSNLFGFTATSNGQFTYNGAIRRAIRAEATVSASNNKNEAVSFVWYSSPGGAPLENTWKTEGMSATTSSIQVTGLFEMLPGDTISLYCIAPSNNTLTIKSANIFCTALLPGLVF